MGLTDKHLAYGDDIPQTQTEKDYYWKINYQQSCDDCISRQAVLDGLASIAKVKARSDAQKSLMGRIMFFVEQLPPVTPKEKTAAWVPVDAEPRDIYECNACGWLLYYEDRTDFKYCPNCGARR